MAMGFGEWCAWTSGTKLSASLGGSSSCVQPAGEERAALNSYGSSRLPLSTNFGFEREKAVLGHPVYSASSRGR